MIDDDFDQFCRSLADGVQQCLFDALEADLFHKKFHQFHGVAVYGDVQRTAAHVVNTVDVERQCPIVQRLAYDWNVTKGRRVQKHPFLVRQLEAATIGYSTHRLIIPIIRIV